MKLVALVQSPSNLAGGLSFLSDEVDIVVEVWGVAVIRGAGPATDTRGWEDPDEDGTADVVASLSGF